MSGEFCQGLSLLPCRTAVGIKSQGVWALWRSEMCWAALVDFVVRRSISLFLSFISCLRRLSSFKLCMPQRSQGTADNYVVGAVGAWRRGERSTSQALSPLAALWCGMSRLTPKVRQRGLRGGGGAQSVPDARSCLCAGQVEGGGSDQAQTGAWYKQASENTVGYTRREGDYRAVQGALRPFRRPGESGCSRVVA